ncbi:MAG: Tol-Pal system subunit TolQ [Acidobacteria bacterium]|nr:MAG: Tol-Pal system subunit TolQ [Acidobacteriota bacterium]
MTAESLLLVAQTPPPELDVIELFLRSGVMAKFVFAILAVLSVASWSVMISKALQYRRAERHGAEFLEVFRRSKRFSEVSAAAKRLFGTPLVGLFQAGYAEIDAQVKSAQEAARQAGTQGTAFRIRSLVGVERSLRRAIGVELGVLSKGTPLLATTASASPFIGLFGTVWGIMVAFDAISAGGSASINVVAPGIAEALINTAAGLAAAIPALVGYNYFGFRMRMLRSQMDDFVLEFLNLTERNFT